MTFVIPESIRDQVPNKDEEETGEKHLFSVDMETERGNCLIFHKSFSNFVDRECQLLAQNKSLL